MEDKIYPEMLNIPTFRILTFLYIFANMYHRRSSMNYEWDQAKNLSNIRKHKVSFEQAVMALEDPYRLCLL